METWTEYGVQSRSGRVFGFQDRERAEDAVRSLVRAGGEDDCTVVGRQVTASDWLPVDQGGAS